MSKSHFLRYFSDLAAGWDLGPKEGGILWARSPGLRSRAQKFHYLATNSRGVYIGLVRILARSGFGPDLRFSITIEPSYFGHLGPLLRFGQKTIGYANGESQIWDFGLWGPKRRSQNGQKGVLAGYPRIQGSGRTASGQGEGPGSEVLLDPGFGPKSWFSALSLVLNSVHFFILSHPSLHLRIWK